MAFKIYESRTNGVPLTFFEANTLDEAVEIIARERNDNLNSAINHDNTFRLVELIVEERDVPFRIAIGGAETAIATIGNVTVTA